MNLATAHSTPRHFRMMCLDPDQEIMPGMRFGRADELLTPAYWRWRCASAVPTSLDLRNHHGTLEEEVGFCLLGGFGVTFEIAAVFFQRLRDSGALEQGVVLPETDFFAMLNAPATVGGQPRRYRFPNQRARRLHLAMAHLSQTQFDQDDAVTFRRQIQSIEGVGPKTASWIARNWLDSDSVAILDIHVLRAGWFMNLFDSNCCLPRDYLDMENRFLRFARSLDVRASLLDSVMWHDMRTFGSALVQQGLSKLQAHHYSS